MPPTAPTTTTRKRTSPSPSKSSNSTTTAATTTTTSAPAKQQQQQEPQYWLREEEMKLRYGIQTYGRGNWTSMANSPLFRNSRYVSVTRFESSRTTKGTTGQSEDRRRETRSSLGGAKHPHTKTGTVILCVPFLVLFLFIQSYISPTILRLFLFPFYYFIIIYLL